MKINKDQLLAFYDKRQKWSAETGSPVSAITGIIGEDLVLGLFCHFIKGQIQSYRCKPIGKFGEWLDAWVSDGKELYQVEVKNWSAHSIGGLEIPDDPAAFRNVAQRNLTNFLTNPAFHSKVWKVLGEMTPPPAAQKATPIPVLAFWAPVAGQKSNDPTLPFWFECQISDYRSGLPQKYQSTPHRKIRIFSSSLYLRSLGSKFLNVPMPRAEARLQTLENLIGS